MSLSAFALTLVSTAEDELGIAADSETVRLERYIHAASDAIAMYLGRAVHFASGMLNTFEIPDGRTRVLLPRYPVTLVSDVLDVGESASVSDYDSDLESGILTRESWPELVQVLYSGGWVTPAQVELDGALARSLPHDIEHACLMTVVSLRRGRGRDSSISSEAMGPASVAYGGLNTAIGRGTGGIIPDTARAILDRYREVRLP